jgi:hypothetical protein
MIDYAMDGVQWMILFVLLCVILYTLARIITLAIVRTIDEYKKKKSKGGNNG